MDKSPKEAYLHSVGAIVRHSSPFSKLEVPAEKNSLSKEFTKKWVTPLYMLRLDEEAFLNNYQTISLEVNQEVTLKLLSEYNWRPRIVGAYFSAIKQYKSLEDLIGRLLLRSDLCDAGRGYCLALASINSEHAIKFLKQYLEFYLTKIDLWYDQGAAMGAIAYLDKNNGTDILSSFMPLWEIFVENKPNWDLESEIERCDRHMAIIDKLSMNQ